MKDWFCGTPCLVHGGCAVTHELRDGEIVAAVQEERFTRKKHDADFPMAAFLYCLVEAGIGSAELDAIAFYDKPITTATPTTSTPTGLTI